MVGGGLLLLLVSTAVNVLQAQRIQVLLATPRSGASIIGQEATPVAGTSTQGQRATVMFDDHRPTVLYYFSPTCSWCEKNWANVRALHDGAAGRYRLVAVTSERGLEEYARRHQLALDVIEGISEDVRAAYVFYGTPHTVVVDASGVVTHEWRGAFNARIARQIEDLFGVSLPGVQAVQPATERN
jgi:hypothetical protein